MKLPTARTGESAREVAHRCAEVAHRLIRGGAATRAEVTVKGETPGGRQDIVTATDPAVERAVIAILTEAYPDHAVLGEESGAHAAPDRGAGREAEWRWIIDPIDGTRNFAAGIPLVGFNLALYRDTTPALGLTLSPFMEEIFYAEAGGGTRLNGNPVQASRATRVADAILAVDLSYDDAGGKALLQMTAALWPGAAAFRTPGTVALGMAYVAAGRFDIYLHPAAYAWDYAPGVLLIQEAGGIVTDFSGAPLSFARHTLVAAGTTLHPEALALVRALA